MVQDLTVNNDLKIGNIQIKSVVGLSESLENIVTLCKIIRRDSGAFQTKQKNYFQTQMLPNLNFC